MRHARHARLSLSPTARQSILNPRRPNRLETRVQHARLVLHQSEIGVQAHAYPVPRPGRPRAVATRARAIMSPIAAPAEPSGTRSLASTRNSISTGRSVIAAPLRSPHHVVGRSARRPASRRPRPASRSRAASQVHLRVALALEQLLPLADHAQVAVVDDGDLDGHMLGRATSPSPDRHLEAAVAGDARSLSGRVARSARPWRPALRSPSCRAARGDMRGREPVVLRGPHLVLADVGHDRSPRRAWPRTSRSITNWGLHRAVVVLRVRARDTAPASRADLASQAPIWRAVARPAPSAELARQRRRHALASPTIGTST